MKSKPKADAFTDSLKEGDRVAAQVISSEKGAIAMKTDGGFVFRAKLDAGIQLLPGDEIQLEVSGKGNGSVTLSIIRAGEGQNETEGESGGQTSPARDLTGQSRVPFERKLAELNITVTDEKVRLMQELMEQNPGMKLDEAAFLASNRLTSDEKLMKAALALLSGGEKTDAFVARLLNLLNTTGNSEFGIRNSENDNSEFGIPNSEFPTASLTSWLMQFGGGASGATAASGQIFPGPITDMQTIIAQSDINLQSQNVENVEINDEFSQHNAQTPEQPTSAEHANHASPNSQHSKQSVGPTPQTIPNSEFRIPNSNPQLSKQSAGPTPQTIPNSEFRIPNSTSNALTKLLSELPEFRATPAPALERFSNMLLRVASDSANPSSLGADRLAALLDKLFAQIGENGKNGGERLKNAREELYARLALIEEEVSRTAPRAKPEMLEQVRRLVDHVRLLNNIDQFVYMQLPIKMGQERKTAELYLFKRKGGKRADPENVNILLALELENMGHWEALINFKNKDVSIQMEVAGEKEKEHFSENTVLLHEMLAEAGFKLLNTDIKYSKKETTPLNALSSLERYKTGRTGMIDYKV